MNAGLPPSFAFPATGYYTESRYTPKDGAIPFFSTNQWTSTFGGYGTGYGVIGWDYGKGRVVSFSASSEDAELRDPNYARLLANAAQWSDRGPALSPSSPTVPDPLPTPTPEPSSLVVIGAGVLGWLARARSRRGRGRV